MNVAEKLRSLSGTDFATFGMNGIAYVKPTNVDGQPAYEIHAADGTPMAVVADREVAFAAIRQHDLEPADVH
jgi:hypothetical protein